MRNGYVEDLDAPGGCVDDKDNKRRRSRVSSQTNKQAGADGEIVNEKMARQEHSRRYLAETLKSHSPLREPTRARCRF